MEMLKVLSLALALALTGLLIMAAIRDSRHYIIDNRTVAAVLACGLVFHAAQALLPIDQRLHADPAIYLLKSLALAVVVFLITAGLFALGVMGGGDVKLISVMMIWAGPDLAPGFLILTSLAGGLVSAFLLVRSRYRKWSMRPDHAASQIINPLGSTLTSSDGTRMAQERQEKVPYGLGICAGGLYVAWILLQRLCDLM